MLFLLWDKEVGADIAISIIDDNYGCPYMSTNGYIMKIWSKVTKSATSEEWGFFKPVSMFGKSVDYIMSGVASGYTEVDRRPDYWVKV